MAEKLNLPHFTPTDLAAMKPYKQEIGAWYDACDPKRTAGSWQFCAALILHYQRLLAEKGP